MTAILNPGTILALFFIAIVYDTWGLLGKYTGATGPWMSAIVFLGTFIGAFAMSAPGVMSSPAPSLGGVALLLLAGILNGVAVYVASVKMVDPSIPSAIFFITLLVLMVVLTPFISWLLNGETLTPRQWLGVLVACLAIYLLVR